MKFFPSREEFHLLSIAHTVVPVWTEVLADMETPVAAYMKLVGDKPGFLLESVENGERWSRYSFVGRNPLATLVLRDGQITTTGEVPDGVVLDKGMLAAMESLLSIYMNCRHFRVDSWAFWVTTLCVRLNICRIRHVMIANCQMQLSA